MNRALLTAAVVFGVSALLAFTMLGAPASAQTPSPTATTATTTPPAGATTTATPAGQPTLAPTIAIPSSVYKPGGGDFPFAHPAFQRVWDRTDSLVASGRVSRTWFWGPGPNTPGLSEQY